MVKNNLFDTPPLFELIQSMCSSSQVAPGLLSLNMNDQSIEKDFSWELDENSYEIYIKTSINVLDWGAEARSSSCK